MKLPRHGHGDGWTDSESQSHRSRSSNSRCNQPHLAVAGTIPQQHPTPIATQPLHFHKNLRDQKPLHKQKKNTHTHTHHILPKPQITKKGTERDGYTIEAGLATGSGPFRRRIRPGAFTGPAILLHCTDPNRRTELIAQKSRRRRRGKLRSNGRSFPQRK